MMVDMQGMSTGGQTVPIAQLFGRHLIGREVGALIRRQFFSQDPTTWPSALNFEDVEQSTESCIDEIFGSPVKMFGIDRVRQVEIVAATPSVRDTVEYVLGILAEPPANLNAKEIVRLLAEQHRRIERLTRSRAQGLGRSRIRKKK